MILLILITILICLVIIKSEKYWNRFKLAFYIPGPWFIPFIGCIQLAVKMKPEDIITNVKNFRKTYKQTFRLFLGPNIWIFLNTPEENKQALNDSTLRRADDFQHLKPILGEGLLLSEGPKWYIRRKALTPAFHTKILEDFTERITFHADILIKNLEAKTQEPIEISEFIFHCILDAICETSMGAEINSQNDPNCQYAKAYHEAFHLLFRRMVNPLLWPDFIYKRLEAFKRLEKSITLIHDMTHNLINERRLIVKQQENDSTNDNCVIHPISDELGRKSKKPLLDILLTININGKFLSDKDIKDEVNTFLFAGVDTTKSAMCFALYNLAKNQDIQKQLNDEISTIFSESKEMITPESIKLADLLDKFLKESLRLHTIVPLTGRQTTCETKIGERIYPKDVSIWIDMYGLAHDEKYFPNPYEFKIDRFNNGNEINPNAYLPFSTGPHNCIGKRYAELIMKILMIRIIQNFHVKLKDPNEELQLISEMVLSTRQGFNLIFEKRKI